MDIQYLPYQLAGTQFTLQRWHRSACEVPFICLYTDCLMLNIKPLNSNDNQRHFVTIGLWWAGIIQSFMRHCVFTQNFEQTQRSLNKCGSLEKAKNAKHCMHVIVCYSGLHKIIVFSLAVTILVPGFVIKILCNGQFQSIDLIGQEVFQKF